MRAFELERTGEGVVAVHGDIDIAAVERLVAFATGVMRPTGLVIDLSDVTLLDSMGVQALLAIRSCLTGGAELVLRHPRGRVAAVLDIVRADGWPGVVIERAPSP